MIPNNIILENIRDAKYGDSANNLEGNIFYDMTLIDGVPIIQTIIFGKLHDEQPTDVTLRYYDTERGYSTYNASGTVCSKYINDGLYFTPQEAIGNWMSWYYHYTGANYRAGTIANKYNSAYNSDEMKVIRLEYPECFI